jgi:hypothetical protein
VCVFRGDPVFISDMACESKPAFRERSLPTQVT